MFGLGDFAAHLLRYLVGLDAARTQLSAAERECLAKNTRPTRHAWLRSAFLKG